MGNDVYQRIEALLKSDELQVEARALLLLKMCRLCMVFNPEKTGIFWPQLMQLKNRLTPGQPEELKELMKLRETTESGKESGFATEVAAMVDSATEKISVNAEAAGELLRKCEDAIKKRFLPFGKEKAWLVLINGWLKLDRRQSLRLLQNVSFEVKRNFITGLNKKFRIKPVEWDILSSDSSLTKIIVGLIDDEQELELNEALMRTTTAWVRQVIKGKTNNEDETGITKEFDKYEKLVLKHMGKLPETVLGEVVEELYFFLTTTTVLSQLWLARFNLLARTVKLWINAGAMDDTVLDRILDKTPVYLKHFINSYYSAAKLKSLEEIEQAYNYMSSRTAGNYLPEACFLLTLIKMGAGEKAIELAKVSKYSDKLLPALRKLLLFYNGTEGKLVTPEDVAGDQLAEFLAQKNTPDRVEYLKKITGNGINDLPERIWSKADIISLAKLLTNKEADFTDVNPMYASIYFKTTVEDEQFVHYLRLSGYGVCKYGDVDAVLMVTLAVWAKEDRQAVRELLKNMWKAIKPDEYALRNDLLRNDVLERCRNVFCVDPDFLINDYIAWFRQDLVNKGISWREGDMMRSIKFPDTAPLRQALLAAMSIGSHSSETRDAIIAMLLDKLSLDAPGVEIVAQLYSEGKEILDMKPPVKLSIMMKSAWQTGIVNNSIKGIIQEMADSGVKDDAEESTESSIKLQA